MALPSTKEELEPNLRHWLTAMAIVFFDGDEDAAWIDLKDSEKKPFPPSSSPILSNKAQLILKATKSPQ